jgi:hypothetical protein
VIVSLGFLKEKVKLTLRHLVYDTAALSRSKEIIDAIWGYYIPEALKAGSLKLVPEPVIVGKGLEKVADACELLKKGASAVKYVVEL